MAQGPDRWVDLPPVAVIPTEASFDWFAKQLRIGGAISRTVKGKAVIGVLDGIVWQANGIAGYVVVGECRGLMQFVVDNDTAEIEQLVTAANARGAAVPMLEWLINAQHATTVKLFPTQGSVAAYEKLGFVGPGEGGYMRLVPGNSAYWANPGGGMKYTGPPPPPPAAEDDVPPPPPPAS